MYKLLSITEYAVTRDVVLLNQDTGTEDVCFDDSALISDAYNFEFMEVGEIYDCKIKLFGRIEPEKTSQAVLCRTVEDADYHGMVKIAIGNDYYYVSKNEFADGEILQEFYFDFSRKDLFEVNGILHEDY